MTTNIVLVVDVRQDPRMAVYFQLWYRRTVVDYSFVDLLVGTFSEG